MNSPFDCIWNFLRWPAPQEQSCRGAGPCAASGSVRCGLQGTWTTQGSVGQRPHPTHSGIRTSPGCYQRLVQFSMLMQMASGLREPSPGICAGRPSLWTSCCCWEGQHHDAHRLLSLSRDHQCSTHICLAPSYSLALGGSYPPWGGPLEGVLQMGVHALPAVLTQGLCWLHLTSPSETSPHAWLDSKISPELQLSS